MAKKKTGTKEWAESNVNIQIGCEHGCLYCYARYQAVKRFKICTAKQWLDPVIVHAKVNRLYLDKRPGVVMFPSTHNITPRNIEVCTCILRKLLAAGNEVLLVSKPHFDCIREICDSFQEYRKQLSFRFTIGSKDDRVLSFWEPNAPVFLERLECLLYACASSYQTSVSCEPFLDCDVTNIAGLFTALKPHITDSFWIGKLREFDRRVVMTGVTSEQEERFVKPLKAAQVDQVVWVIYNQLRHEPLIRWKDSIRDVVEK